MSPTANTQLSVKLEMTVRFSSSSFHECQKRLTIQAKLDPKYPDPMAWGFQGKPMCGVFKVDGNLEAFTVGDWTKHRL